MRKPKRTEHVADQGAECPLLTESGYRRRRAVDHHMDIQAAVNTPRLHHQWMPDTIYVEENAVTPQVRKEVEADGYKFTDNPSWGSDEGITIGSRNGKRVLYGANADRIPASATIGN